MRNRAMLGSEFGIHVAVALTREAFVNPPMQRVGVVKRHRVSINDATTGDRYMPSVTGGDKAGANRFTAPIPPTGLRLNRIVFETKARQNLRPRLEM